MIISTPSFKSFIKLGFPYFREARFVPLVTYNNYTAIRFKLEAAKIQTLWFCNEIMTGIYNFIVWVYKINMVILCLFNSCKLSKEYGLTVPLIEPTESDPACVVKYICEVQNEIHDCSIRQHAHNKTCCFSQFTTMIISMLSSHWWMGHSNDIGMIVLKIIVYMV